MTFNGCEWQAGTRVRTRGRSCLRGAIFAIRTAGWGSLAAPRRMERGSEGAEPAAGNCNWDGSCGGPGGPGVWPMERCNFAVAVLRGDACTPHMHFCVSDFKRILGDFGGRCGGRPEAGGRQGKILVAREAIPSGQQGDRRGDPCPPRALVSLWRGEAADFPAGRIRTLYVDACDL